MLRFGGDCGQENSDCAGAASSEGDRLGDCSKFLGLSTNLLIHDLACSRCHCHSRTAGSVSGSVVHVSHGWHRRFEESLGWHET